MILKFPNREDFQIRDPKLKKQLQIIKSLNKLGGDSLSWQKKLRMTLYIDNIRKLETEDLDDVRQKFIKKVNMAKEEAAYETQFAFFETPLIKVEDEDLSETAHGYYSCYIPIKQNCRFDDEVMWNLSYLQTLQERNNVFEHTRTYEEISSVIN